MAKLPNEDLFSESTMSFGEHLEELRSALSKALIGLLIGFLIGLCVANYVVKFIQSPLTRALEDHYIAKSADELKAEYDEEGAEVSPEMLDFVRGKRFVYEKIYVEAAEIARVEELLPKANEHLTNITAASANEPPSDDDSNESNTGADPDNEGDGQGDPDSADPVDDPLTATGKQPQLHILGEDIPPPRPVLVATRVWRPINTVVEALNAQEAFMIWLKAAFVAGLVISSPYMFWHIWNFVAAGLYPHEKKYVYLYLPFSMLLFLAGASLAFFFVFEHVLNFLFSFNKAMNIDIAPRISEWLSFVLFLPLGFGIAFQLPLVMLFLHRIGLFSIEVYLSKWRLAVLVIFVISMLLTPADPISMLLMAVPLTFLYFLGVMLCKWMPRTRNPFNEAYEP